MEEVFKDVPWYEWIYKVSNLWRVKSLIFNKEKILTPQYNKKWYLRIWLYDKDRKFKTHRVHRLVMLTFMWASNLDVNHINSIRDDNRLSNLEYISKEWNTLHRMYHKTKERCPCCHQTIKKSRN